ncbi:HAMP domain-containing sensor histidine kinase [Halorubrum sp. BV1]|uniref:sensor histidine kinase n=1 Tax=Halorubrum sp. BV1 TaxID=1498500 RepID=UPI000679A2CE|nr:HAMP domain-containing sensor histidine kinase [Halorubrum sp. BV1]
MERRPGIAYRRPDGDPDRFVVESVGESRLDPAALPRNGWSAAVADADTDRFRAALGEEEVDVAYRLTIDDAETWVHERAVRDDRGNLVGYLFTAGDRVERNQQLERQRERLEEFASVVSHDLRNPLSVAVGNVELAMEFDGDDSTDRLDRALDALDWMDDLISDLLALAREGRSVEETTPEDLTGVVEEAWRTVGPGADARLVVTDPLPRIECDRRRLRQALENLFHNALEHGTDAEITGDNFDDRDGDDAFDGDVPPGTFTDAADGVSDVRKASADDPAGAEDPAVQVFVGRFDGGFYVADDGDGIDPADRDTVFEPGHTTVEGGTGFGLPIVDRIAQAHGWDITVAESRTGGARFEFDGVSVVDAGPCLHADDDTDDTADDDAT